MTDPDPDVAYRTTGGNGDNTLHTEADCYGLREAREVKEIDPVAYPTWDWCLRCTGQYDVTETGSADTSDNVPIADKLMDADSLEELREGEA